MENAPNNSLLLDNIRDSNHNDKDNYYANNIDNIDKKLNFKFLNIPVRIEPLFFIFLLLVCRLKLNVQRRIRENKDGIKQKDLTLDVREFESLDRRDGQGGKPASKPQADEFEGELPF